MPKKLTAKHFEKLKSGYVKTYGDGAATLGSDIPDMGVIPTGVLALDHALGLGGWPIGVISHVYAPADIGKSNCIGLGAVRGAQQQGLIPAVVAIEPGFDDPDWMRKHGVDPDLLLVLHPETGEEAVEMALRVVRSGDADLMVFDSIGALLNSSEQEDDGKTKAGGQSGLVSRLVKNLAPASARHRVCSILLNQVRADFGARHPGSLKYPGGYTLDHMAAIHVRLRYGTGGKKGLQIREHGDPVTIGREITAIIERNKLNEGSNHKATFDFYIKDTGGEYPFGVDRVKDVVTTGKRTGVLQQAGSIYTFEDVSYKGSKAVEKALNEDPALYERVRTKIMETVDATGA